MSNQDKLIKEFCWEDVLLHNNNPEVRIAANIDLKLLCESVTDPKDPRIRDLGHLFKKTVSDSHALVQDEALDALIAYLKAADADVAGRYANEVCDAVMTICIITGGPEMVEKAQIIFMLLVELEAVEAFLDAMQKAVTSQVPRAVILAIDFMIQVVSEFGRVIVPLIRVANMLLEILDHQDQNVIASSKGLTRELCSWLGINAIKSIFYDKMSDKMKGQLDVELPTVQVAIIAPRRLRSEPEVTAYVSFLVNCERSRLSEESAAESQNKLVEQKDVEPSEMTSQLKNASWKEPLEETNQLEKVSLSDSKEHNKKDIDGEDGNNQFQKSLPARRDMGKMLQLECCTECGVSDDWCKCKRIARLQNTEDPHRFDRMYGRCEFYVPTLIRLR